MIIPDLNLLVYAHSDGSPYHSTARDWWEGLINGGERVGVPWAVATGFVRLMTHPRVLARPAAPDAAVDLANEWFRFPQVTPINPGVDHLSIFRRNLAVAGVGANLVTNAHVAALAMEYQAEVHSNDSDFSRFPGLRWRNPLRE